MKFVVSSRVLEGKTARQPEQSHVKAGVPRVALLGPFLLIAVLAAAYLVLPALSSGTAEINRTGQGKIVNVLAAMDGFDLKEIHIQAAEKITVNLSSLDNEHHTDGGGKHQFAIDELGVNIVAEPSSSASATFTANKPGVYTYYCDICCGGKANPAMNGKFVVDPAD
jgi:heme/copper-type cytochrome/quinol oxidase subunit 2